MLSTVISGPNFLKMIDRIWSIIDSWKKIDQFENRWQKNVLSLNNNFLKKNYYWLIEEEKNYYWLIEKKSGLLNIHS